MTFYDDWQEAASHSIHDKAVSETIELHLARYRYPVYGEIIKPLRGDPYCVWKSAPGLPIYDGSSRIKPHAVDLDRVKRWRPWGEDRDEAEARYRAGGLKT